MEGLYSEGWKVRERWRYQRSPEADKRARLAGVAGRPYPPAAAEASAPSFTLLFRMARAPRGFITSRTKSVACPPSCKPKLPPSRAIIVGALHGPVKCSPVRQLMAPRP